MYSGGKYWLHLWGGIGDFIKMYYAHKVWRKIEDIKNKNPNVKIKALVYSLNKNAKELIEYHPAIDEIFHPKGKLFEVRKKGISSYAEDYTPLASEKQLLKQAKETKPKIYLSPTDKQLVDETIKSITGKFVIIHPFSAMSAVFPTTRTTMPADKYIPIVEGLSKKGIYSIILGCTNSTEAGKQEKFSYESPYVKNLIDKTSVRSALDLVKRSHGFIGTNSCFMCAAFLEKKPSYVITSSYWKDKTSKGFIANNLKKINGHFVYLPEDKSGVNYNKIQQKAIEWFS